MTAPKMSEVFELPLHARPPIWAKDGAPITSMEAIVRAVTHPLDTAAHDEPDDVSTGPGFGWGAILFAFVLGGITFLSVYTGVTHG